MKAINEIIGEREAENLRGEFNDLLWSDGASYGDVEELLLGYGLDPDYLEQLIW